MNDVTNPNNVDVKDQHLSFEQGLKELEEIVTKMEEGRVNLEDAVSLYERGIHLQKLCRQQLEAARLRIEKIALTPEGEVVKQPFQEQID